VTRPFRLADGIDRAVEAVVARHFEFCADRPWENGGWPEWTYLGTADELLAYIDAMPKDGLDDNGRRIRAGVMWEIWRRVHENPESDPAGP